MAIRSALGVPVAAVALVALTACSSFVPATAGKMRGLDYINDDIASLVVAFDVPVGVQPVPEVTVLKFDVVGAGQGERHVAAALTYADAGEIAGTLPPPSSGRTYFLFGFAEKDRAALREAQAWARGLPAGTVTASTSLPVSVVAQFCATAPVDPALVRFSVHVALPGASKLEPLVREETLANALRQAGLSAVPACT